MRSLLTLSVLLALVREDKGQPTVSLPKKFPDVIVGDDVTLICSGGVSPVKWFIDGVKVSHEDYIMVLTAATSRNNGDYACERDGSRSEPYKLTVLELEPHAQLFPSLGGAVMAKGAGRNLVLQVEDDLKGWECFVSRGHRVFRPGLKVDEKMMRAVFFAEPQEAKRATFWCKNNTERSNSVTLKSTELRVMLEPPAVPALTGDSVALRCVVWGGGKVEKAAFYKDKTLLTTITQDTYVITGATENNAGKYHCHATYRYSHISATAAQQEGDSDDQELNVIVGPPAAAVDSVSPGSLRCSCSHCPADCTSYRWYHTLPNDSSARRRLPKTTEIIAVEDGGLYSCRKECEKGLSRLSNVYNAQVAGSVSVLPILVAAVLMVLGVLIVVLVALKRRRRGGSSVQATARDKDKTGGDYEQIQLGDQAVYHTLGESTDKDKNEGGYEALQKKEEEALYNTLGAVEGQGQVEGEGEGQGGYEALKSVKVEVYQTLSSADSKTPAGEAEGGYEQLPQKTSDYEDTTLEENPYEELKAGKLDKKQMSKKKE